MLALATVVAHGSHGGLKVGCCLLLDLVSQVVDLETVQPEKKLTQHYSGDAYNDHLISGLFKGGIPMVQFSNGWLQL